jgi:hypothetical protein
MTGIVLFIANLAMVVGLFELYKSFFPPNGLVAVGIIILFWLNIFLYLHWNEHHRRLGSLSDGELSDLESTWLTTSGFQKSSARPSNLLRLQCGNDRHALLRGLRRVLEIREEVLKRAKERNVDYEVGKIATLEEDIKINRDAIAKLESELAPL